MAHFEIKNLSFSYPMAGGRKALDNINLTIERGQYVTFCGRSGCGKTTLLRQLKSALTPHGKRTGEILFDGTLIGHVGLREQSARIGYVMQDPDNQIVTDKVWHELAFGLESLGVDQKTIRLRVAEMASYFGIQGWFHKKVTELSGGQKQLLAFGSVYAMGPELYVLDEPTANLDQEAIARLHDQIAALKRQGCTIVVAEHRLYFLTDLIDRAFYLRSGVLERVFTGEQFRSLPDPEREALGLRTLTPAICTLPAVESAGSEEGLSVEGLTCSFRKGAPVFRDLSFSARPGEVVAITGPNGVGKTTLSRCLCGLLKEQAGQILLNGKPLDRKGRQRSAFCVMQDVNHQLFSDSAWGECRMSAPEASDNQISEVLDSLHLLSFRERHPMSLSGGQKQRLAVATALLSEKPVLIFDEPTSGLDYARMVEVSGVIRSLARHGRIVLVVTHDQEFMQRACDRVLRL